MLAWIRSPRGSTMTATVAAVVLALFWLEPWQKPLPVRLPFTVPFLGGGDTPPAVPGPQAAAPPPAPLPSSAGVAVPAAPAAAPQQEAALQNPGRPAAIADTPSPPLAPPAPGTPGFDIVRVEPTGDAVIAGRAEPGSDVALLDGDTVIGRVQADAAGEFTLLPNALAEGSHYLTLQTRKPGGEPIKSVQGVAVSVAKNAGTKPMVALLTPDKPAEVLSDGSLLSQAGGPARRPPASRSRSSPWKRARAASSRPQVSPTRAASAASTSMAPTSPTSPPARMGAGRSRSRKA